MEWRRVAYYRGTEARDCNDEGGAPQGSPHAVKRRNNLYRKNKNTSNKVRNARTKYVYLGGFVTTGFWSGLTKQTDRVTSRGPVEPKINYSCNFVTKQ